MKPVFQKVVAKGNGDCFRCCVASILELDAEDVPNFRDHDLQDMNFLERWFHDRGLALLELYEKDGTENRVRFDYICGAYAIADVASQRFPGGRHAVVVHWEADPERPGVVQLVVAHDPNPGNEPYDLNKLTIDILWFIVPVRPVAGAPDAR
jgi:hypothetical protein